MRTNDSGTPASGTGAGASSTGSTDSTGSTAKPTYGHGSRESDVAHVTGAYIGEEKAARDRANAGVRTIASTVPGEPPTIEGETVEQMRARVARERDAAEPTPFQRSLTGRRPADMGPAALGGGALSAPATGAGGTTSAPVRGAGGVAPASGTVGSTTGTTGTTDTAR
jgi:hypothetical protein